MKKIIALVILLINFAFLSLGQNTNYWMTHQGDNWSVQYPSTWQLNLEGYMGTSFVALSTLESESDAFSENVNLQIQDIGSFGIGMDEFVKISEDQVKNLVNDGKLIRSERVKRGDKTFHIMEYTGTQGTLKLHFLQYFILVNSEMYILTFTTEDAKYAKFLNTGIKILDSFTIQ